MKKEIKNVFGLILCFSLAFCFSCEQRKTHYCLMVVDVSMSLTDRDLKRSAEQASAVMSSLSEPFELVVRAVDFDTDSAPQLIFKQKNDAKHPEDDKRKLLERDGIYPEKMRQQIVNRFCNPGVGKDCLNRRSCMLVQLSVAYKYFEDRQKHDPEADFSFIFISDMYEACWGGDVDTIFSCVLDSQEYPGRPNDTSGIFATLDQSFNPSYNLKEVLGNDVKVIIVSSMRSRSSAFKCLNSTDREVFWQRAFEKVGYSHADFDEFHFSTFTPAEFNPK